MKQDETRWNKMAQMALVTFDDAVWSLKQEISMLFGTLLKSQPAIWLHMITCKLILHVNVFYM